ncbi:hypothetical protein [Streptomyces botrytidirepellens]|nr:hypothetical protein [Streptomyces botrytidirepellens]
MEQLSVVRGQLVDGADEVLDVGPQLREPDVAPDDAGNPDRGGP